MHTRLHTRTATHAHMHTCMHVYNVHRYIHQAGQNRQIANGDLETRLKIALNGVNIRAPGTSGTAFCTEFRGESDGHSGIWCRPHILQDIIAIWRFGDYMFEYVCTKLQI